MYVSHASPAHLHENFAESAHASTFHYCFCVCVHFCVDRNAALCQDRENKPLGALNIIGNGFYYRRLVPILPLAFSSAWLLCNWHMGSKSLFSRVGLIENCDCSVKAIALCPVSPLHSHIPNSARGLQPSQCKPNCSAEMCVVACLCFLPTIVVMKQLHWERYLALIS